ncbi:MAG: hypothetical protein KA733_12765 [Thauera sp.]|nr:hypothetical protein [Thauera sp.]
MPDAPMTDEALVEQIAQVASDAMAGNVEQGTLVDLRVVARAVLAHLHEQGMLATETADRVDAACGKALDVLAKTKGADPQEVGLTSQQVEVLINEAGRDAVFAQAQALGWTAEKTPPLWVWAEIAVGLLRDSSRS